MRGKKNWRLSKTLARNASFRPIEDADVKYAWAAYRKGALPQLGFPDGMDALKFKAEFEKYVFDNAEAAWTILIDKPIGLVFGGWAPQQSHLIIVGIAWFPWATKRNILEGTVDFFNRIRKQFPYMGFAGGEHKKLYEICCMHGIMRRVGTSQLSGQPVAVFEGKN